jgi:hypothetical protein
VDDYFPSANEKIVFSKSLNANEMWVSLLEKAYAKLYKSYEAIESGSPCYALRDLTGAPTETLQNGNAE